MESKKWKLNKKDFKDIAVMIGAYIVSYIVVEVLPFVDFGKYNQIVAMGLPILTYAVKKAQQGK